eukprot:GFKZ01002325.1.p1 GENE.GFKZ01002325.1~~GFKZ01002325.1.p1  ORF type:complete len:1472 (-),score=200.66 GFKZ01002325.1:1614-6029(-)
MGVPKFYRFISERYPLINCKLQPHVAPRIDNLYLDMNGIIHNCVRASPASAPADRSRYASSIPHPRTPNQIFQDVFKYIDNLFTLLPPRSLLYMAVDGVAPRAKMNQQRSRRFRSAQERRKEHEDAVERDPMYAAANVRPFDSNCITPGTEFMHQLTLALQYFVARKISEDRRWQNISVVLSGAEVPGEGEHKIMEYIRAIRESGAMTANTRHCVYGLDADLIMLALVTHEPHFFILREKVDFSAFWRKKGGPRVATQLDTIVFGEFELLSIGVLREYLALELGADGNAGLPFFDVERIADDFVFILMLIGNDFLPHLPTLDISIGTLGVMLHLYKRCLPVMGGYLTHEGKIVPHRMDYFFAKLGMLDKTVMQSKIEAEQQAARGRRGGHRNTTLLNADLDDLFGFSWFDPQEVPAALSEEELRQEARMVREMVGDDQLAQLKANYYDKKFTPGFSAPGSSGLNQLTQCYVEGIWWTLRYYTEGCRHWRWYFPYHYAPLASDLYDVSSKLSLYYRTKFVSDRPFRPLEQLLSVLPPISSWCLPKPFRPLMTNDTSPIRDLYPEEFDLDMNGKRSDWEAVVLLPFVSETRLMQAIASIPHDALTSEEQQRSENGSSFVYRYCATWSQEQSYPLGNQLASITSNAKRMELKLPTVPDGTSFTAKALPGTQTPLTKSFPSDMPTLASFPLKAHLESVGVNIFGMPSRSESLVLDLDLSCGPAGKNPSQSSDEAGPPDVSSERRGLSVGSYVWYGYPWRMTGQIESYMTLSYTHRAGVISNGVPHGHPIPIIDKKPTDEAAFKRERDTLVANMLQRKAIVFSAPLEVLSVRNITETSGQTDDSEQANAISTWPPAFVKPNKIPRSSREARSTAIDRLTEGQTVLYIGSGAFFGHKAVVQSVSKNGIVKVEFSMVAPAAREPAFGYRVVDISSSQRWFTLSKLASDMGLPVPLVDYFLGSIRVRLQNGKEEMDLGLGIKYIGRALYIPGYARPDERHHYSFSEKTLDILRRYQAAFPHLFTTLATLRQQEAQASTGKSRGIVVYSSRDLFGDTSKADDAARSASTWLSVQEIASIPLVPATAHVLAQHTVAELEKHASISLTLQKEFQGTFAKKENYKKTREVTRQSLITGAEGWNWGISWTSFPSCMPVPPDGSTVRLGDRVVNRIGEGSVPFGLRGTVVGIHPSTSSTGSNGLSRDATNAALVEVVFDEGFIGGGTLGGRCSEGRGKAVSAHAFFILRPDRENDYYAKHYARVAAKMGIACKRGGESGAEGVARNKAIAKASIMSYAEAVKKQETKAKVATVGSVSGSQKTPVRGKPLETRLGNGVSQIPATLPLPKFVTSKQKAKGAAIPKPSQTGATPGMNAQTRRSASVHMSATPSRKREMGARGRTSEKRSSDAKLIEELLKKDLGILGPEASSKHDDTVKKKEEGSLNTESKPDDTDEFASVWASLQKQAKMRSSRQKSGSRGLGEGSG